MTRQFTPIYPGTRATLLNLLMVVLLCSGAVSATFAADLSRYRNYRFGADLATVAKLAGENREDAKLIQSRPARIQELKWRPRSIGALTKAEAVSEVVFTFYNDELYRIAVHYDRYETAGMTNEDLVESVVAIYGPAKVIHSPVVSGPANYGDPEELVAVWEDASHSFELTRRAYGPTYKLVGVLNRLVAPEQAATIEAARLDEEEAPQREAAVAARSEADAKDKLDQARQINKKKFRP